MECFSCHYAQSVPAHDVHLLVLLPHGERLHSNLDPSLCSRAGQVEWYGDHARNINPRCCSLLIVPGEKQCHQLPSLFVQQAEPEHTYVNNLCQKMFCTMEHHSSSFPFF